MFHIFIRFLICIMLPSNTMTKQYISKIWCLRWHADE